MLVFNTRIWDCSSVNLDFRRGEIFKKTALVPVSVTHFKSCSADFFDCLWKMFNTMIIGRCQRSNHWILVFS